MYSLLEDALRGHRCILFCPLMTAYLKLLTRVIHWLVQYWCGTGFRDSLLSFPPFIGEGMQSSDVPLLISNQDCQILERCKTKPEGLVVLGIKGIFERLVWVYRLKLWMSVAQMGGSFYGGSPTNCCIWGNNCLFHCIASKQIKKPLGWLKCPYKIFIWIMCHDNCLVTENERIPYIVSREDKGSWTFIYIFLSSANKCQVLTKFIDAFLHIYWGSWSVIQSK
jgi:hypothetical protein